MKARKVHFQSPFHFLISLFSWTPRERLVIDPGALHVRAGMPRLAIRARLISNLYFPNPLGIAPLCDTDFPFVRAAGQPMRTDISIFFTHPDCAR